MSDIMKDRPVSELRYTVTWRNPYKPRPEGLPKILCSSPFEEDLTLPWIMASNWGLSAWAIGIYFEHPKPKRKMDEEKRASMRRKRMQTRVEKTAPLFADEFEKKELQQRPDWAKTIVIHADTTAPYSEKKLQQIYWLFFKTLGITDESRKKYTLRFHVRFARPDCDYYVEFADMIINDRVRF